MRQMKDKKPSLNFYDLLLRMQFIEISLNKGEKQWQNQDLSAAIP